MQVEVTKVSFRKDEADATVSFRPRGPTDPNAGMANKIIAPWERAEWVRCTARKTPG